MSKKRQSLRSSVSSSLLDGDAQLYDEPKTPVKAVQSPAATSRSTRLTRSTLKKVEDTPSRSSRCTNGAPATSLDTEIQKTPRRQLHQTLTDISLSEDSQEAGKISWRGSQSVTGAMKRDHTGRWLPKSHPGKLKVSSADSTQGENSPVQQTKSERTKEPLKPSLRKSMRIAKQLNLDSPRSPIDIERNASQPEESVDTNGGPHVTEQSETQTSDLDTRDGEQLAVRKLDQDDVEMEKQEDKEGQSICDISASFVLEPESLSVKISRMSPGSGRNSRKLRRKSVHNAESASVENSPEQQTKTPNTELESTEELLKSASRESMCVVKQLKLDSSRSPISNKDVCPEHKASQPEESVDTNGGPPVKEQSETQTPNLDTTVGEELEVGELDQGDMEKEEDKEEQSLCDISASGKLEPKSLSGQDADQNSTHGGSDSAQTEDALDTEVSRQANVADKQEQKVVCTIMASGAENSKSEEPEGKDQLVVEDLSPKKSQESAFGGSPPYKQANGSLGDGTELEAVQSEEGMEENMDAVDKETCEVMGKQEMDEAATREPDEEVGGGDDQAEEIATKPKLKVGKQKVGKQNMKEREKTSKPAYHLVVSNLDTERDFAELQIAIISFFMVRRLLVTSIRMKKSRKRGYVTFLSRKDVNRALKYNGQQLLGRAVRLRRPLAALSTKKSKKEPISSLRKRNKKQQAQEAALSEKVEKGEKKEFAKPSLQQPKKRKWEELASEKNEEGERKEKIAETLTSGISPSQKKRRRRKKKKQQQWKMEGGLTEQMVKEWSQVDSAVVEKEEPVLSQQGAEEGQQAAGPRKRKKQASGERRILLMENLPYLLSKKYLRSVFRNAEGIRVCQDSQPERVAYVRYRTASEARETLKEFQEKGFPGQVSPVTSMVEKNVKPESKSGDPGAARSLFLWGMSSNTTVDTLKSSFKEAVDARISEIASKRFAVVDFRTAEEAARAKDAIQHQKVDGQKLNVHFTNSTQGEQESVRSTHDT